MVNKRIGRDPVLYEIYVRSFSDSNGDGVGDIPGITQQLDHLAYLGVDGIWITPIFESPQFDYGYDVSNYYDIHSEYGSVTDLDTLISEAHDRNLAVILDMILSHTSVEHPWFIDNPERYIWADNIPNNWTSVFGGPAWSYNSTRRRYYYHRFYPEQPNLNWHNPDVRHAMHDAIQFWVAKGVDGFRLDSLDGLAVDPALRDEPQSQRDLEGRDSDPWADYWNLDHIHTCNLPKVLEELENLTRRFPETSFVVEADLPSSSLEPYMAIADSAFAFDFIRAPLDGRTLARIIENGGRPGNLGWALSNHDQTRLVTRWGRDLAGVAAVLLLTVPGWSFVYQGDEIGMVDGPGGSVAYDRSGRDAVRHPMQWDRTGGFSTGTPWLPMIDPERCNVADQIRQQDSMLQRYRRLIGLRRQLSGPLNVISAEHDFLAFKRNDTEVALNLGSSPRHIKPVGEILYATADFQSQPDFLPPRSGLIYKVQESQ